MTFSNTPLRTVVAQVRFPHIYQLEEPASVAGFQRTLSERYPLALARDQLLSLGPGGVQPEGSRYRFASEDESWLVALTPDWVSIETTSYDRFEGFSERIREVINHLSGEFSPPHTTRIGLRYINELPATEGEWRHYVHTAVQGLDGDEAISDQLVQSLHNMVLDREGHGLQVHYGLLPPVNEQPQRYVLDLDAYSTQRVDFELEAMLDCFGLLKETCWSFFRGSITDSLIAELGGQDIEAAE